MTASPSGEQHEITFETHHAVITEVGGGLRSFAVDGRDVVDGYDGTSGARRAAGQLLVPSPNRLEDGVRLRWSPPSAPLRTRPRPTRSTGSSAGGLGVGDRVSPGHAGASCFGPARVSVLPFALGVEYTLSTNGLSVRTTAVNVGGDASPYGTAPVRISRSAPPSTPSLRGRRGDACCSTTTGPPDRLRSVDGTGATSGRPAVSATILATTFTDLDQGPGGRHACPRRIPRPGDTHAVGRPAPSRPHALHRRSTPPRSTSGPRRRADDLPAERLQHEHGRHPRTRRIGIRHVGHQHDGMSMCAFSRRLRPGGRGRRSTGWE